MSDTDLKTKEKVKSNLPPGPGPGRPKGLQNKKTLILKDLIFKIHNDLEDKGKGMTACAKENPKWFYENFVKPMVPKEIDLGPEAGEMIVKILQFGKDPDD